MKIPLSRPDITNKEISAIVAVLKTPHLSLGPKLPEFEKKFAQFIGTKHALAVNSGTSGLHLCVRALDIKAGDEVITTPFSFIASANCILFEKAHPVFVDIRSDTLNIDEKAIEAKITSRTRAILPVHVFGYPPAMDAIRRIAKNHKLAVIEDACEALGAKLNGKSAGLWGDCAVFAFYPNKQMTTGEGGMVVTNNDKIARLVASMRNQGRDEGMTWLSHARLGYNYRLSDINCALGIAQLDRISEILKKREKVAALYQKHLSDIPEIILPPQNKARLVRSWFVYMVQLKPKFNPLQRDAVIKRLRQKGIGCNVYFPAIHLQPLYIKDFGYKKGDFPITERVAERTIALPFFNNLTEEQIGKVAGELRKPLKEVKKIGK